jgi:pyroglutamyl-peptidase
MTERPALVTGFAPYAGRGSNPAADIANALDGCIIANVPVVARLLPVALEEIAVKAESLLDELHPRIVINVGLWPGEATVRIERVALNLADFEIPDNRGLVAHDESLSANGPTAKFATLPIRKIEEAILEAGIPSRISNSAGSFLCNACFYSFLSAAEKKQGKQGTLCGFFHVPYLPQQVAGLLRELKNEARLEAHQRADYASMDAATGTRAVAIALETALRELP